VVIVFPFVVTVAPCGSVGCVCCCASGGVFEFGATPLAAVEVDPPVAILPRAGLQGAVNVFRWNAGCL
jgi:hypothetical protein